MLGNRHTAVVVGVLHPSLTTADAVVWCWRTRTSGSLSLCEKEAFIRSSGLRRSRNTERQQIHLSSDMQLAVSAPLLFSSQEAREAENTV